MAEHLDQYAAWLKSHEWTHTPERFHLWAFDGFLPRWPCRGFWPYDPKPLMVVSKPEDQPRPQESIQR